MFCMYACMYTSISICMQHMDIDICLNAHIHSCMCLYTYMTCLFVNFCAEPQDASRFDEALRLAAGRGSASVVRELVAAARPSTGPRPKGGRHGLDVRQVFIAGFGQRNYVFLG